MMLALKKRIVLNARIMLEINDFSLIGKRIRDLRISRNFKTSIAHEIRKKYDVKIDPSYLSRMERGKTEIPLRTLFAIADFFDVKPSFFIGNNQAGPTEASYIFDDPELANDIIILKKILGEKNARKQLKKILELFIALTEDIIPVEKSLKAAQPKQNEKS